MSPKAASPAGPSKQPSTSISKSKVTAKAPGGKPASPKPKPPPAVKDGVAPQLERKKVQAKSLAEIEAQYPEGSIKRIMVSVLKAQKGHAGLSADGIANKAKELKLKTFNEEEVAKIKDALSRDPNFCKLQKGIYSLHTFHPKIEIFVRAVVSKKRKADGVPGPSIAKSTSGGAGGAPNAARLQASLTIAQRKAKEAAAIVTKHKAALKRALSALEAAKEAAGIAPSEDNKDKEEGTEEAAAVGAISANAKKNRRDRDSGPPQFTSKELARFELRESEKEYKGDPDDRKAMLEHRQKMQTKQRELEKAKEAFIKAQNDKYEKEKNNKRDKLAAVRKAERAVDAAKDAVAAAENAAEKVGKKLETQVVLFKQNGGKVDEKQQKQLQPIIRAFKPMDDNELDVFLAVRAAESKGGAGSSAAAGSFSQLRPDVFSPDWVDGQDAARLASTVYVSDVLNQFGRCFGLAKPLRFADFEKALKAASEAVPEERKKRNQKQENNDDGGGEDIDAIAQSRTSQFYKGPASPLHDVYYNIMRILIEDMRGKIGTNDSITRRLDLITPGSWPEVLRRDVISSKTSSYVAEYDRPEDQVVDAASALLYDGADGLTADQHLTLLHYLADEVLQTERLRSILQKREEEAADLKRDVREDMAKERSKLKELIEAEKDISNSTKRRKLEILGQLHGTNNNTIKNEDGSTNANASARGKKGGEGAVSAVGGPSRQLSLDTPDLPNLNDDEDDDVSDGTEEGGEEEEEDEQPSFELPEELQTFKGNPKNKKAMEEFELKQAAAQKKLEAQRSQYLAEHMRLQREKAEKAIEKLASKKEAAEEALAKAQEVLEAKMENLAVRRAALGSDRHHRRYWILPKRAVIYVEDEEFGRWGVISTVAQLDELLKSLDRRGLREVALAKAFEKRYDSLVLAMRRVENSNDTDKNGKDTPGTQQENGEKNKKEKMPAEKMPAEPLRQSRRDRKQAEFFDPTTGKASIRTQQQNQAAGGSGSSKGERDGRSVAEYAAQHRKHKALAPFFGPSERTAFLEAVEMLLQLYNNANELNIEGPSSKGSWKEWLREVHAAAEGKIIILADQKKPEAAPNAAFLLGLLQGKALELENMIYNAGDNPEASDEEDSGGEENEEEDEVEQNGPRRSSQNRRTDDSEMEDGAAEVGVQEKEGLVDFLPVNFSPVKGGGSKSVTTKLWKSGEWRQRWLLDLRQGSSNARLVYCLGVLKQHSQTLFRFLKGKGEEEDVEKEEAVVPTVAAAAALRKPGAAKELSRKRRLQEKEEAENRRAIRSRP